MRGRAVLGRAVLGREVLSRIVRMRGAWDAERLQAALNVVGGVAFLAGSLLFLDRSLMRLGIGLFVLGSFAMAVGAVAVWRQRYAAPRRPAAGTGAADPDAAAATRAGGQAVDEPL